MLRVTLLLLLGGPLAHSAIAMPQAKPETETARLVRQLGSESFAEREGRDEGAARPWREGSGVPSGREG